MIPAYCEIGKNAINCKYNEVFFHLDNFFQIKMLLYVLFVGWIFLVKHENLLVLKETTLKNVMRLICVLGLKVALFAT